MSRARVIAVEEAREIDWQEAARRCPNSTFFHTPAWARVWAQYCGEGVSATAVKVRFEDGVEALLPAARKSVLGGALYRYASSAGAEYGDWISETTLKPEHSIALDDLLKRVPITLRQNPFEDRHAHSDIAWSAKAFTQAIDLRNGFDRVMHGWSASHRRSLRQAGRNNLCCEVAASRSTWAEYFELYRAAVTAWGEAAQTNHDWRLFEMLQELPAGTTKLWTVRRQGVLLAGAICFYHGQHAVYWSGATVPSARTLRPVHYLFHDALSDACNRGIRWFDFGSSGGIEGLVRFKSGFGCQNYEANLFRRRGFTSRLADRLRATQIR